MTTAKRNQQNSASRVRKSRKTRKSEWPSLGPVFLKDRLMPNHPCPHCRAKLDACTGISSDREGTIPTIGAITVCAYCGTLLEFAETGYVRASRHRLREVPQRIRDVMEKSIGMPIVAR